MGDATRVRFKKFFVPLFLYSESLSQQNINFNSNVWLLFRRIKNVTVYMQNATPDNMLGLVRRLATSESSSSLAFNDNAGDPTSSQRLNREHERRASGPRVAESSSAGGARARSRQTSESVNPKRVRFIQDVTGEQPGGDPGSALAVGRGLDCPLDLCRRNMVDGRGELLFLWARDDDGFGNDAAFSGVGSLWPEAAAAKIDHYLASFGGGRRCPPCYSHCVEPGCPYSAVNVGGCDGYDLRPYIRLSSPVLERRCGVRSLRAGSSRWRSRRLFVRGGGLGARAGTARESIIVEEDGRRYRPPSTCGDGSVCPAFACSGRNIRQCSEMYFVSQFTAADNDAVEDDYGSRLFCARQLFPVSRRSSRVPI